MMYDFNQPCCTVLGGAKTENEEAEMGGKKSIFKSIFLSSSGKDVGPADIFSPTLLLW